MRTASTGSWKLGAMLAAGLTLRHYKSFEACPSLPALKERYAREMAEYDRLGIHVLASQNGRGELLIGDSHEYDDDIEPFDQAEIERLVLGYLATFLQPPNCTIASRWHGIYVKHPSEPWVIIKPTEGVTIVTGVGGAGMTLSFGLAERIIAAMT
jgi:glycine/D-amino acid oxidase-like deaminating enzyme